MLDAGPAPTPAPAPLALTPVQLQEVLEILALHAPEPEVRVFGSRARGTAKPYSDLDLALMTGRPLTLAQQALLNEAFDESNLPFKVDLVDWAATSAAFQDLIMAGSVVIQAGQVAKG
jgi:predicted nucleotidyltransferase